MKYCLAGFVDLLIKRLYAYYFLTSLVSAFVTTFYISVLGSKLKRMCDCVRWLEVDMTT